ncbi:MAG: glycerol-3-phosphate 1-O-acyltransferase PlsY [Alphaproteobacteria bacterium]|nr:glycerol-3-phosphate 1-O-acyltransferase PlsY [Alphaproteobacteria bacterium]
MLTEYFYPVIAYVLGSIPFGLIFSEFFGIGGLRQKGSGNIGSTNVLRTQGKLLGALTLLCDFFKAFVPCCFFETNNEIIHLMILAAPTLGHMFPVWLKFKGGKGVATYLGTICAINWMILVMTIAVWVVLFVITRISSVSGLTAVICSLVAYEFQANAIDDKSQLLTLLALVLLIIYKHKDNIRRLWNKEEKQI